MGAVMKAKEFEAIFWFTEGVIIHLWAGRNEVVYPFPNYYDEAMDGHTTLFELQKARLAGLSCEYAILDGKMGEWLGRRRRLHEIRSSYTEDQRHQMDERFAGYASAAFWDSRSCALPSKLSFE